MNLPSIEQAEAWLLEAARMNPGPWLAHSRYVAQAAQAIASAAGSSDPQAAYLAGLLHDLGRRAGVTHLRHVLDGYHFLTSQGYPQLGEICLTHSFPDSNLEGYFGERDISESDRLFLEDFLARRQMSDLDHLIQLCDSLALPEGFCLVEKRLVDVAVRYGTTIHTAAKWRAILSIQEDFSRRMGGPVYSVLPGAVENTFRI